MKVSVFALIFGFYPLNNSYKVDYILLEMKRLKLRGDFYNLTNMTTKSMFPLYGKSGNV